MSKILIIDDDEQICTSLGASRTLAKPFDRDELKQAVDELPGQKSDLSQSPFNRI